MSVEQVANDFVKNMNDSEALKGLVAPDAMASGGVLPQPIPVMQAMGMVDALVTAMPDLSFDIEQTTVNGDEATVRVRWSGTQSGPLNLPQPGMPSLPPTGKKVSVKDAYVLTVRGDKVSHMRVESPADGGIPAALEQLGVNGPAV
jgi:hypothetical protein